jgi:hypothetical protein
MPLDMNGFFNQHSAKRNSSILKAENCDEKQIQRKCIRIFTDETKLLKMNKKAAKTFFFTI